MTTSAAVVTSVRTTTTSVKSKNSTPTVTVRVTAPRLVAQAEKNAATLMTSTARSSTSFTNSAVSARMSAKVVTTAANQTFAAKLTEASNQGITSVNQGSAPNKGRTTQVHGLPHVNVGPTSPQTASSINQGSPKHHRPTPTASAPPNMQHYQAPGKLPFSGLSTAQVNSQSITEQSSSLISQARSPTPIVQHTAQCSNQDDINSGQTSSAIPAASEYSLFNSMAQQPMWRRENESQKPVNFAAVTGGSTVQASAPPKFIEQEPPQVDASKAPGYRGTAVCSPVSSKTSSNSATPPNMPLASGAGFQCFQEPLKSQPLPPIGSTIMHNRPASQSNQNDLTSSHFYSTSDIPSRSMQHLTHSDTNLYKSGSSTFSDTNTMLNMGSGDGHLLSSYHQSSAMQHMSYSQPQQTTQGSSLPAVSMSRLNPKAPDFSSTVHSMPSKQSTQMYNGYNVGSQNSNGMFSMSKSVNTPLHRSNLSAQQQRNWQLMQMQQPFTQQQTELISGMATGMTLHSLARAAGTEILENGAELGVVNSSPAMSPSLPGPHTMHSTDTHYIEDRKQPQPIGTERARKIFNPNSDNNWMFGNDNRNLPGLRWQGNNAIDRYSTMQRGQIYVEDIPHMMMDSFQVSLQFCQYYHYVKNAKCIIQVFYLF